MWAPPRLFVQMYGTELKNKMNLLLSNGEKLCVNYCRRGNLIYGLEEFDTYCIKEDFIIFFDYLGNSQFYVSMFGRSCMEISNDVSEKLLLEEALAAGVEEGGGQPGLIIIVIFVKSWNWLSYMII